MPSGTTPNLRLALPVTGELSGAWGNVVNQKITSLIDSAIAGTASVTMLDADYTLTVFYADSLPDESREMFVTMTGTLTGTKNVICPSNSKLYFFRNNTTGGYALTLKTSAGTGISVPNGKSAVLYCDGTNVLDATTYFSSMTLGSALPVTSGGTGGTTSTGTGAVALATSPTLVTPLLGTPQSGDFSTGAFTWPTFNQNTSGTAAGLSTTLAIGSGGTGQTTAQLAINALSGAVTNAQYLRGNGTNVTMSAIQAADVPTLNQNTSGTAAGLSSTLVTSSGGTGLTAFTENGVMYASSTSALATGSALTFDGVQLNVSSVTVGRGGGNLDTNTAVGTSALLATNTGTNNTAVGRTSLRNMLSGENNTAFGSQTLVVATTTSNNTAVGAYSGYGATGSGNTFFGSASGAALLGATGSVNTFIGAGSGSAITTGSKNTIIGAYSGNQGGVDIRTASNNIILSDGDGNPRGVFDSSGKLTVAAGIVTRVNSQTTTTSPWAWNSDSYDQQEFTALANALTINADAGTPANGQQTIFRFTDNGTAQALTWTTGSAKSFRAVGVLFPTTTIANKTLYVGCVYNSTAASWDVIAVAQEA